MGPREPDLPGQIKSFLESWNISVCSNEAQIGKTKVHTYTLLHKTFLHLCFTYVPCYSCPCPSLPIILCYVCTTYVLRMYVRIFRCTYEWHHTHTHTLFNQYLPSSVLPSYSCPYPSRHIILCCTDIRTYLCKYRCHHPLLVQSYTINLLSSLPIFLPLNASLPFLFLCLP